MPVSRHTRRSAPYTVPVSRMNRAWPAMIALAALVVLTAFEVRTMLAMALATLLAGGFLLAVMPRTAPVLQPHHVRPGRGRGQG